jgi:hypothetical protein
MILLLYNLFYMFFTYGLHPNFVVTKYGRDTHVINKDKTTRCHYMAYILVITDIINQWFTIDYVSLGHE